VLAPVELDGNAALRGAFQVGPEAPDTRPVLLGRIA